MKRISGLDLVRVIAVIFIPAVHFFAYNGFYSSKMNGSIMFASTFIRWLFYIGVPLFMILTGYLKRNKKINKDHYKSLIPILFSYLLISIICILFKIYYFKSDINFTEAVISIFNFSACNYAWYIEMYIGLFLLIPFLNILYNNLETKKSKQILIITLTIICSFSPVLNYFIYNDSFVQIASDWWCALYPLIYYFIGCYINEYKININKIKLIVILLLTILVETVITYVYNYNDNFSWNFLDGYNSIFSVIASTTLFLLLYNINIKNKFINKLLSHISIVSLDIYLFSYISDNLVYDFLDNYFTYTIEYLKFMVPIILISFLLAYLMALIKYLLSRLIISGRNKEKTI